MKISVLCPTRKRHKALKKSINSLYETASEDNEIELLLAFDTDDKESVRLAKEEFPQAKVITLKRQGYKNLHKYYNALAEISTGDWLFIWNDDAIMTKKDWDKRVEDNDGKFTLVQFHTEDGQHEAVFPIVPREYYEVLGHISLNAHNDSWIWWVMGKLDLVTVVNGKIRHERADITGHNNDSVYKEREYQTHEFLKDGVQELVERDREKIREYIS